MKTALSANHVLERIVSSSLFLQPETFVGMIRDLAHGKSARVSLPVLRADDTQDEDPTWPWEVPIYSVQNGVAVVDICGALMKGFDDITCWWYGFASTDRIQAALADLATREDVGAVILKISSPGGMVTGTPETAAQIAALAQTKLVVAVTDMQACSAAYWLASQATMFYTTKSATVGSIGTYIALYDYSDMMAAMGIKLELIKAGKYKAIGVAGNPLTDDTRGFLEESVARTNEQFLSAVRSSRPDVADETMQGQWFDGDQAVALGLADKVVASVAEVMTQIRSAANALLAQPITPP